MADSPNGDSEIDREARADSFDISKIGNGAAVATRNDSSHSRFEPDSSDRSTSPSDSKDGENSRSSSAIRRKRLQTISSSDDLSNGDKEEKAKAKVRRSRKLSDEILQLAKEDPELLGIRRSGRARKEVQRFEPVKSSKDSDDDSDSDSPRNRRRKRRKQSESDKEEEPSGSDTSEDSGDWVKPAKRSVAGKRRKQIKRAGKAGKKSAKKSGSHSSDNSFGSDEDSDDVQRNAMRRGKRKVNYREDSGEEETDSDELLEAAEEETPQEEPPDDRDGIEKILKHRRGRKGATGSVTTMYNVEDRGDPNSGFQPSAEDKGELQYLIKWIGWSHMHNTWESEETIRSNNVKGIKKLENYMKRQQEIDNWRKTADKDYIEYFECEQEMNEELYEQYYKVERIIAHSKSADRGGDSVDFYVKWVGLPYSDCSWEVDTLIARWYKDKIAQYYDRSNSQRIPNKSCKVIKQRPKFVPLKEQPTFIGGGVRDLTLRDYQLDGLNWLSHTWCKRNGAILADEMGLGKTIQTISFLSYLANVHSVFGPFLLVVPLSTLDSWRREFEFWSPDLNVITYIGDIVSRDIIRQYEFYVPGTSKLKLNCVLTTYEIVLKDKSFLAAVDWAVLLVDEAHRLKNDESLLYKALAEFKTSHRLLITGTPLQNSLKELWALLHFIEPDKFPTWDDFEVEHHGSENKGYASLHKELEPYLLRRVKKDVEKSLPAKVEQILRVDMTGSQKQFYKWILTKNYRALSKGVKGSISGFLNVVMELKKCCNHPFLIRQPEEEMLTPADRLQQVVKASGKLILLDKLLCRLYETGHRVLIFSQMVMMLDIVQEYLRLRKFNYQRLDGSIRGDLRKQALDHFNAEDSKDFCFLLSTRAGGLGINLATADTVIIFDSDWNPQNDLQAQSRAHRIGQTKQVNIYRLVTKGSVEEDIVERAKRKLVLDHLVIQRMDTTGRTVLSKNAVATNSMPFNRDELNAILKFGAEELFKEREADDEDPEVDIDDILQRAETREMEQHSMGDELLSQFKVANFSIDEESTLDFPNRPATSKTGADHTHKSWDDIIPENERRKVDEEEEKERNKSLAPRQRNRVVQKMARNEDIEDEEWNKDKKTKKGDGESESEESSDDDRPRGPKKPKKLALYGFTEAEVRKFVKSFRKFAQPLTRLESIACDAELEEHSRKELQLLAEALENGCRKAVEDYTQASLSQDKENSAEVGDGKRRDRGPVCKLGGVEVAVKPMLKAQADLEAMALVVPAEASERRKFKLPCRVKPQRTWDVDWTEDDDAALLRGVYEYGFGSWERVKMDPDLSLIEKILPTDKMKKPQAKHLQTRADYLLRCLQKRVESVTPHSTPNNGVKRPKFEDLKSSEKKKEKRLKKSNEISEEKIDISEGRKLRTPKETQKPIVKPPPPSVNLDLLKVNLDLENDFPDEIFKECKASMRLLKEELRKLSENNDVNTCVLKIGDRIGHCLVPKEKNKKTLNDWHSYFWIFASKFTEMNGAELHSKYRKLAKRRLVDPILSTSNVEQESRDGGDSRHKHKHHHHHHKSKEPRETTKETEENGKTTSLLSSQPAPAKPPTGSKDFLGPKRKHILEDPDVRSHSPLVDPSNKESNSRGYNSLVRTSALERDHRVSTTSSELTYNNPERFNRGDHRTDRNYPNTSGAERRYNEGFQQTQVGRYEGPPRNRPASPSLQRNFNSSPNGGYHQQNYYSQQQRSQGYSHGYGGYGGDYYQQSTRGPHYSSATDKSGDQMTNSASYAHQQPNYNNYNNSRRDPRKGNDQRPPDGYGEKPTSSSQQTKSEFAFDSWRN